MRHKVKPSKRQFPLMLTMSKKCFAIDNQNLSVFCLWRKNYFLLFGFILVTFVVVEIPLASFYYLKTILLANLVFFDQIKKLPN